MSGIYCRACGTPESERQKSLKEGKVNCCPERSVNDVIELRHGFPATSTTAWSTCAEALKGGAA